MLQTIFDEIIAQPWFDLNEFSREAFASQIIHLYGAGEPDFDQLRELGALMARAHFSRGTIKEKQKAKELLLKAQRRSSPEKD